MLEKKNVVILILTSSLSLSLLSASASSTETKSWLDSEGKRIRLMRREAIDSYERSLDNSTAIRALTSSIIINGTQTYVIANGTYTLNDTIIVEDTATLIIKNATVVFNTTGYTVIKSHDNATIYIEDSAIERERWSYLRFYDSSIVSVLRSEIKEIINRGSANVTVGNSTVITVNNWGLSHFSLDDSSVSHLASYESSHITISDSSVGGIAIEESSDTLISNSTIGHITLGFTLDSNVSLTSIPTGFVGGWGINENNTLEKAYVNLTMCDTCVGPWCIVAHDWSVVSIAGSKTDDVYAQESSTVFINDSIIGDLYSMDHSVIHVFDTQISWLEIDRAGYVNVFVIDSTYSGISWVVDWETGNPRLHVGWYLDALVIDGKGCPLPNAHVKVYWENGTLLTGTTTDDEGLARFILYEKMVNATGTFPYGSYTAKATYNGYTYQRVIRSITGNMKIKATPWICICRHGLIYGIYTEWVVIIRPRSRPIRIPIR